MKPFEHLDLTPFEYACALGNLSGLKIALTNQEPDVRKSIYLNGLLLAIENNHLSIYRHLISLDSYQPVLTRYYQQICHHIQEYASPDLIHDLDRIIDITDFTHDLNVADYPIEQIPLPIFTEPHPPFEELSSEKKQAIQELACYYESALSGQALNQHLQNLKDELAKRYQMAPAYHQDLTLPLDWESFKFITAFVSDEIQNQILEAYYQHPTHTAWRFIASSHQWGTGSSTKSFDICQDESASLLILTWFAAKDTSFPNQETRLNHFFASLAAINREGNRQEAQISLDWIEDQLTQKVVEIDDLTPDLPCKPHLLKVRLLAGVIEHPLIQTLSAEELYHEALNFMVHHWTQVLQSLSLEQYLMLKYYLKSATTSTPPSAYFELYQRFFLNPDAYLEFERMMQTKWGWRWRDQTHLHQEAKNLLLGDICKQHGHHFARTLEEIHPDVQQTNIQTLGFFRTVASSEPLAHDQVLKHH